MYSVALSPSPSLPPSPQLSIVSTSTVYESVASVPDKTTENLNGYGKNKGFRFSSQGCLFFFL